MPIQFNCMNKVSLFYYLIIYNLFSSTKASVS